MFSILWNAAYLPIKGWCSKWAKPRVKGTGLSESQLKCLSIRFYEEGKAIWVSKNCWKAFDVLGFSEVGFDFHDPPGCATELALAGYGCTWEICLMSGFWRYLLMAGVLCYSNIDLVWQFYCSSLLFSRLHALIPRSLPQHGLPEVAIRHQILPHSVPHSVVISSSKRQRLGPWKRCHHPSPKAYSKPRDTKNTPIVEGNMKKSCSPWGGIFLEP